VTPPYDDGEERTEVAATAPLHSGAAEGLG